VYPDLTHPRVGPAHRGRELKRGVGRLAPSPCATPIRKITRGFIPGKRRNKHETGRTKKFAEAQASKEAPCYEEIPSGEEIKSVINRDQARQLAILMGRPWSEEKIGKQRWHGRLCGPAILLRPGKNVNSIFYKISSAQTRR
jgi:hypothetical protein